MSYRVGVLGLWHETNTYASHAASLGDFADFELLSGESVLDRNRGTGSVIGGFADAGDLDLVGVFSAGAWPCGPADRDTIEALLERAETALRRAGRLDAVLVNLHGAMVAQGRPDAETALLDVLRDVVGEVPVAAVLDLHANPSPELVSGSDVLISYDTYPHVDMRERGREAAALLAQVLGGRRLRTAVGKVPMLVCPLAQATDAEPMRSLQERAGRRGRAAGLARVCIPAGFAYSDVDRAGISVLAVHDAGAEAAARDVIAETLADIQAEAAAFALARDDAATAVRRALALLAERSPDAGGPVVLADVADNIGGGSPGDGTALLAELLRQGSRDAVVTIADPMAARLAADAGVGADVDTRLGGRTDERHGEPVYVRGRVLTVTDGRYRTSGSWMTGREFDMGTTAVLQVDGVSVVVTTRPTPPFHAEQLTSVGIDPAAARILVVKGAIAWRAAFGDIASEVIEVATPGVCPVDLATLPRRSVPMTLPPTAFPAR
ncbi:M81 family metallopeptidase [Dactylosporangium sp. NPDC000555]|uniref:M81 family metallopeptidase n=1 Tax=Dactylosporangium sp. NPDC000555 TaxID=3154260 RepID=UPI003324BAD6